MAERQTNADKPAEDEAEHGGARYERKDIPWRWLLVTVVVLCCFGAIHAYTIWKFYWFKADAQRSEAESPYSAAPVDPGKLPPEPRLEQIDRMAGIDRSNVHKRLAAKEKILNGYGPTPEKGFVHIPIEQAMKAIAGQLPVKVKSKGETSGDSGLLGSGEPNSGRMLRGEKK